MMKPLMLTALSLVIGAAFAQSTPASPATPMPGMTIPITTPAVPTTSGVQTAPASGVLSLSEPAQMVDMLFMEASSMSNWNEIVSSEAALLKNVSPEVKAYAQKMIADHMSVQTELNTLASAKGMNLSQDPGVQNRLIINQASKLEGAAFQRAYLEAQIGGHENTVKFFQNVIRDGQDEQVRAFAQKLLPSILMHLDMAKRLYQSGGRTAEAAPTLRMHRPS